MSGKADPLVPHPNSIHMFNLITQGASRRSKAVKVHIKDGSNEGTEVVYKPTPLPVTKFGRVSNHYYGFFFIFSQSITWGIVSVSSSLHSSLSNIYHSLSLFPLLLPLL